MKTVLPGEAKATKLSDITQTMITLRNKINDSVYLRNSVFQKTDGSWDRLWAAFDALEDSQVAIDDYEKLEKVMYLELYGLTQAFVVQQDAINHIRQVTIQEKIDWTKETELYKIRRLRSRTTGHPAEIKEDKQTYYCNIDRNSIQKYSFRYFLWSKTGADAHSVNLKDIIEKQRNEILRLTNDTINKIEANEAEFIKKFKGEKVKDIYDQVISYHFQKIYGHSDHIIAKTMYSSFCEAFAKVKTALEARYGSFDSTINAPGLKETISDLDELIKRIGKSLENGILDEFGHRIYVHALRNSWEELGKMIDETDEEFSL